MEDDVVKYNGKINPRKTKINHRPYKIESLSSSTSSIRSCSRAQKKILQQNGPFQPQTIVINPHSIEAVDRIIYLELVANDHVPYELLFNINATRC